MHARLVQSTRAAARAVGAVARPRAFVAAPALPTSHLALTSRLFRSTAFVLEEPKQSPAPIDQQAATELPTEEIPAVSSSLDATKSAEASSSIDQQAASETAAPDASVDAAAAPAETEAAQEVDPAAEQDKIARTVFIGGLSWNVDQEWLEDELLKTLDVTDGVNEVRIARDAIGRSKGFAFVEFGSAELAQQLLTAQAPLIDGRQTQIQASTAGVRAPRAPRTQGASGARGVNARNPPAPTVWVGNIPWSADESSVEDAFGRYGAIRRISIPKEVETGRSRGVAFVEFESVDSASRAFKASTERGIHIDRRPVRVDYAAATRASKPGKRERSTSGRY